MDHDKQQLPSNRKFGRVFTFIFAIATFYAYFRLADIWIAPLLVLTAVTAIITVLAPQLLLPLNQLWYRIGLLMGKVISPIVLGVIFFILITPVSLVTRAFGRDVLLLKKRTVTSYWIERQPRGPMPDSFKDQF